MMDAIQRAVPVPQAEVIMHGASGRQILGQRAYMTPPRGDGAFDHPTPGLDDEALHPIGSLDDLGLEMASALRGRMPARAR